MSSRGIENLYGVILAGGVGSRFWPMSRASSPKQILNVAGEESLLKTTIKRLSPLMPIGRIHIVTSSAQSEVIRTHLLRGRSKKGRALLPEFVIEPFGMNTLPAIGLSAVKLLEKDPEAVMVVLPSDHLIGDGEVFTKTLDTAARIAQEGHLVTFGVLPRTPETGYGYIKTKGKGKTIDGFKVKHVERFVEKPDIKKARRFLKQGGYYWNSGIFVWKAAVILEEIKKHLPITHKNLVRHAGDIEKAYRMVEPISIDHGVLEKSENVMVVEARFSWSDIGSWGSLKDVFEMDKKGNIMKGRVIDIGSEDSFIVGSDRLVATIGLKDMIIVDTLDATLVCPRERAEEVKALVGLIKKKGYAESELHVTVERPWGAYTVLEKGDCYKIKKIRVSPGCRLSLQMHRHRSEHWVVVSGKARVQRGDEIFPVCVNQSTYIPKGVKHRLENPSPTLPLEIIEVQNGDYLEEEDIVRFDDDYERGTA